MLILGVDTSGKDGSIALLRMESGGERTIEMVSLEGGAFSAQLIPQISQLLKKHDLTKGDIDAFAVVAGPGSFTGLRVGLAAIKALAEILQKPIAAVPLLEAVARSTATKGRVLATLDAGRGEFYCGEYDFSGTISNGLKSSNAVDAVLVAEHLLTLQEFVTSAKDALVATPDAKIAELAERHGLHVVQVARPRADAIARLGFDKLQRA